MTKCISVLLIASQVSLASMAFAAPAAAPSISPEFKMVESVLALQGQKVSDDARQSQLNNIVSNYVANAQADGRNQRLQDALVQLGVYTPAQAQAFMSDAQTSGQTVANTETTASAQAKSVMTSEVSKLASMHPMGAQFSACSAGNAGGVVAAAGVVTAFVGLLLRYDNPTCHQDVVGSSTSCGYDAYGDYTCWDTTDYGPTYCDRQDYYPHRKLGDDLMVGGAVGAAIGAIVSLVSFQHC